MNNSNDTTTDLYNKVYTAAIAAHRASDAALAAETAYVNARSAELRAESEAKNAALRAAASTDAAAIAAVNTVRICVEGGVGVSKTDAAKNAQAAYSTVKDIETRAIRDAEILASYAKDRAEDSKAASAAAIISRAEARSTQAALSVIMDSADANGHRSMAAAASRAAKAAAAVPLKEAHATRWVSALAAFTRRFHR